MLKKVISSLVFCVTFLFATAQPGLLDLTFLPNANLYLTTVVLQTDGKIIIGGEFANVNGTAINKVARLNSDGSLDTSFKTGTGPNSIVHSIAVQSDGKIIIGGTFTSYNGTSINRIARLNSDGSLDVSFNAGAGVNAVVHSIAVQTDGKILLGGRFTSFDGTTRNYLARLNSDGSLDTDFNSLGTAINGWVLQIVIQSGGEIIIAGGFTTYKGKSRSRIARLFSDGSLDTIFNPGTGANNYVQSIAGQTDGKLIIAGQFTSFNGTALNRIARLNSDGSLDAGFTPGTSAANSHIFTTAIQSDGKIFIAGVFTSFDGTSRNRVARLNSDGSLDADFNPGTGVDAEVNSCAIQSDGKIIIAGSFIVYNGVSRGRLARILQGISTNANLSGLTLNAGTLSPSFASATTSYTASVSNATSSITVTPTVSDATATIKVNGVTVTNGAASGSIALSVGANTITTVVTAQDGSTTKTYTVTVTREVSSDNNWIGITGNWNNSSNWSSGSAPDGSADINIGSGTVTMDGDITIASGKILTLSGTAQLKIAPQKTLTISGTADFGNQPVVLQSDATGTAAIGTISGTLTNAGSVTVERYIPKTEGSIVSSRRWRLLSVPIENITINGAWQNSGTWNGSDVLSDTTGTIITGNQQGNVITANDNGFDFWSAISNASASIRSYTQGTTQGSWTALSNTTTAGAFDNQEAYLLFIRGNRSSLYTTGIASSRTTLRATGTLKQGTKTVIINGTKGYALLGNPYAAPLDFDHVYNNTGNSSVIKQQFWVWDAATGDYGSYKLIKYVGGVYVDIPTPFTGTTGTSTNLSIIQSGQGFFVEPASAAGGTLTIRENDKAANGDAPVNMLLRAGSMEKMRINLYQQNNNTTALADGAMAVYDNSYNTAVKDNDDVRKPNNFNENMAIVRNGTYMMMEARPLINDKDTLYLEMWNLKQQQYQFQFKAEKMEASGLRAMLEDTYLQTKTAVSLQGDVVPVNFTVTSDAASAALTRFRLLFTLDVTPVTVTTTTQPSITIYPNPLQNKTATLRMQNVKAGRYTVQIENSVGQQQLQQQVMHAGGSNNLQLQLPQSIIPGLYFIKYLRDGVLIKTEKLIIE